MDKVYLVAEKEFKTLRAGEVYWHSIKVFYNKEDAIEYINFFGGVPVGNVDGFYIFEDMSNKHRYYYLKETYIRGTENDSETTG